MALSFLATPHATLKARVRPYPLLEQQVVACANGLTETEAAAIATWLMKKGYDSPTVVSQEGGFSVRWNRT